MFRNIYTVHIFNQRGNWGSGFKHLAKVRKWCSDVASVAEGPGSQSYTRHFQDVHKITVPCSSAVPVARAITQPLTASSPFTQFIKCRCGNPQWPWAWAFAPHPFTSVPVLTWYVWLRQAVHLLPFTPFDWKDGLFRSHQLYSDLLLQYLSAPFTSYFWSFIFFFFPVSYVRMVEVLLVIALFFYCLFYLHCWLENILCIMNMGILHLIKLDGSNVRHHSFDQVLPKFGHSKCVLALVHFWITRFHTKSPF